MKLANRWDIITFISYYKTAVNECHFSSIYLNDSPQLGTLQIPIKTEAITALMADIYRWLIK